MFRPDDIGKIFGQDHLQEILINWLQDNSRIPQSLLLSGPYGTGKTTIARMLANNITSLPDDLSEINAADARGIDEVRTWAESARFCPFGSGGKVYIIDELHQMTSAAQSALLKVIEEPPKGIYFILCTTEPSRLKDTIRSRCTHLETKLLKPQDTSELLTFVFQNQLSDEIKDAIHKKSGGHARDAVKMGETAILMGAVTPQDLHGEIGLGYSETEEVLLSVLKLREQETSSADDYCEIAQRIAQVQDGVILASVLDSVVSGAMINGNPAVRACYKELLNLRALRMEWKITPQQNALYFISEILD
jgi:DNA polymerase-3 subunit gamma/tau